ncbi:MAG: GFA family protein [Alphaproteobacteria bacterium]
MTEGGCLCGQVRYHFNAAPMAVVVCHCTHCQKQSGSAFSTNVIVPAADFVVAGQETIFNDTGDSGGKVERRFCNRCGSPIRSLIGNMPGIIALKAGTLDKPLDMKPAMQIWRRSAQSWIDQLHGVAGFDTDPPAA